MAEGGEEVVVFEVTEASKFFLLWTFCISDKKDLEGPGTGIVLGLFITTGTVVAPSSGGGRVGLNVLEVEVTVTTEPI